MENEKVEIKEESGNVSIEEPVSVNTNEKIVTEYESKDKHPFEKPAEKVSKGIEEVAELQTEGKEEKVEIETVETITRRIRAEKEAEAKLLKSQQSSVFSNTFPYMERNERDNFDVLECDEQEEKRKLQSRGRFVGMNRFGDAKRSPRPFRKVESIDPPAPKPDVSSVVFNLSNNMKVLGSSENGFIAGFDMNNQGSVSWNDLKLDIAANTLGGFGKRVGVKGVAVNTESDWRKGASDGAAAVELSGDELSENRACDLDDAEVGSNAEEEGHLDSEPTWTESSAASAYFHPQGQTDQTTYYTDDQYAMYGAGEWYPMYSELEEIRRQMKQLQKLPEQMKKVQREIQEIDKNVKVILKNVSKDPEEEPGRTQEVNPARHTDRLVSIPSGTKVLVLTDSICSRMNGYKISSELKVTVRSYGGLTATEMITIVSTLDEDVCYDIDYVFFHVGTNDLGAEDFPSLKSEFKILIKRSLKIFSNATIFMSAILPRYGSTRELKDRQELNSLIATLAEKYNRVQFIDASCHFVEREIDNTLRGDLYKRDYIHLTLKGMGVLANSFHSVLEMYVQQNDPSSGKQVVYNNSAPVASNSSSTEIADCGTYAQNAGSQASFGSSLNGSFQSGFGDRSLQNATPVPVSSFSTAASTASSPAVYAGANPNGATINPRQRISGRYTQYRR